MWYRGKNRVPEREGGKCDGNRDGAGAGNENEGGNGHEDRDRGGGERERKRGRGLRGGEGTRESENLRSNTSGGAEDARGGATATSNQQSQPQDPTRQQDHYILRRTRAQGREARDRTGKRG